MRFLALAVVLVLGCGGGGDWTVQEAWSTNSCNGGNRQALDPLDVDAALHELLEPTAAGETHLAKMSGCLWLLAGDPLRPTPRQLCTALIDDSPAHVELVALEVDVDGGWMLLYERRRVREDGRVCDVETALTMAQ